MFDAGKTRMIGLPYGKKNYDNMLSRFHPIPEHSGRTDRRTDRFAIPISRVSMLTHDKNQLVLCSTFDLLTPKIDRFRPLPRGPFHYKKDRD